MGLFDFLKSKHQHQQTFASGSYFNTSLDDTSLKALVYEAISFFENNPKADDSEIIKAIESKCNEKELAVALYRFIPMAYCRLLVTECKYPDEYVLYKSKKQQISFTLSVDRIYKIVLTESTNRYSETNSQEKFFAIVKHSSDFNAINNALKGGSQLQDLECSSCIFIE